MKGLTLPNVQDVGPMVAIHRLDRGRICLLSKVLDLDLQNTGGPVLQNGKFGDLLRNMQGLYISV